MIAAPKEQKPVYAPIPARAIGDARFTGSHYAVLAAVAFHDRLSGARKGQGCWASHDTLAAEANVHYNNLSGALSNLVEWGYLSREPHPMNRRLRVYRVVYNEADSSRIRGERDETDSSRNHKRHNAHRRNTVSPPMANEPENKGEVDVNILRIEPKDIPLSGPHSMLRVRAPATAPDDGGPIHHEKDNKGRIYIRSRGHPVWEQEWKAFADDYRQVHGKEPVPDEYGGHWFLILGEAAA